MMKQGNWELYLSLALLAAVLFFFLIRYFEKKSYPYQACPLLTKREYKFYKLLRREAWERGMLICPKVGLKELMEVTDRKHYMKYFSKISQKHVDFVLCDEDMQVFFALELDDRSHDTKKAKEKDLFKDRAFKAAGIPLKRIRDFDEASVRELFRGY